MNSVFIDAVLLSLTNLCLGLEPVFKLRARLIASLDVEFVRSSLDAFFDREHFTIGGFCACSHWHESTSGDYRITGRTRSEVVALVLSIPIMKQNGPTLSQARHASRTLGPGSSWKRFWAVRF